jgi:hypothetical protein
MNDQSVESHYDVLDLPSTATTAEIKRSFRALARHCHPDVIGYKDPAVMEWAEEQFKRISYAHDTLVDPIKRDRYDEARSKAGSANFYSYAYGYENTRNDPLQLADANTVDYDLAWDEFISAPFAWTEKGLRFYNKWAVVFGLLTIVGIVLWWSMGYRYSSLHAFQFMVTTESAPTVESFMPMRAAVVGVAMAIASTVASYLYAAITHPYSYRYNKAFKRQLFDHASGMLMALTYIGTFAGVMIGRYLF